MNLSDYNYPKVKKTKKWITSSWLWVTEYVMRKKERFMEHESILLSLCIQKHTTQLVAFKDTQFKLLPAMESIYLPSVGVLHSWNRQNGCSSFWRCSRTSCSYWVASLRAPWLVCNLPSSLHGLKVVPPSFHMQFFLQSTQKTSKPLPNPPKNTTKPLF